MMNMQPRRRSAVSRIILLAALTSFAAVLFAEDEPNVRIRIDDLDIEAKLTPKFQAESSPYAKSENRWLQLLLTYELNVKDEEWVDRLSLKWYVGLTPEKGKPLLLSTTVEYVDVEEGICHAVVYVRPGFIRRYYGREKVRKADLLVHVELQVNGSKEAEYTAAQQKVPGRWWDARPPAVTEKRDELLPRTKTPFAALDYDYYEHIRE